MFCTDTVDSKNPRSGQGWMKYIEYKSEFPNDFNKSEILACKEKNKIMIWTQKGQF